MDLTLSVGGDLDMTRVPASEELLARLATGSSVPLHVIMKHPSGVIVDRSSPTIQPSRIGREARLALAPDDVIDEIAALLADAPSAANVRDRPATHLLVSRRERDTMNSFGRHLQGVRARRPRNVAWFNPADFAALGISEGAMVQIEAEHDAVNLEARTDAAVRQGVISAAHGWGGLPANTRPEDDGASTARLVARDRHVQTINAMPRLSGIPVVVKVVHYNK